MAWAAIFVMKSGAKKDMNNIQHLGFDNWFEDKSDLSKTADFNIERVISVNKNTQRFVWLVRHKRRDCVIR